jgi:hypothetical protein
MSMCQFISDGEELQHLFAKLLRLLNYSVLRDHHCAASFVRMTQHKGHACALVWPSPQTKVFGAL